MRGKRIAAIVVSGMAMIFAGGCISVDYTPDKEYAALAEGAEVEVVYDKSALPGTEGDREKVGVISASASTASHTLSEIKRKVVSEARSHGANLVFISSIDTKKSGDARADQLQNLASPTWTTVDDTQSNFQQSRDMMLYSSGADPEIPTYTITVHATFYRVNPALLSRKPSLSTKEAAGAIPSVKNTPEKTIQDVKLRNGEIEKAAIFTERTPSGKAAEKKKGSL